MHTAVHYMQEVLGIMGWQGCARRIAELQGQQGACVARTRVHEAHKGARGGLLGCKGSRSTHLPGPHVLHKLVGMEHVVPDLLAPLCSGATGRWRL